MQGCLKAGDILHKSGGNMREDSGITCTPGIVQLMWDFRETGCLRTAGLSVTKGWNLRTGLKVAPGRIL